MGGKEHSVVSTPMKAVHAGKVICSKCGQVVRYPREWIIGENGTIICASCYREVLFPNIKEYSMEMFD